ncbi:unnamed protein product [Dracunculus medinensis]|uniref:Uncharacterized protein n=1 Tax=Dracunculus medinensis TaxID=318479 RepID=A0A0N4UG75_DRAME|nr:unnamed protein product [Dracunculus medinensis]
MVDTNRILLNNIGDSSDDYWCLDRYEQFSMSNLSMNSDGDNSSNDALGDKLFHRNEIIMNPKASNPGMEYVYCDDRVTIKANYERIHTLLRLILSKSHLESSNRTLLEKAVLGFSIKHDFWIEKLHTDTLIEIASHNQNSIISFANLLAIIAHCCDSPIKYLLPPRIVIGKVRKYHESEIFVSVVFSMEFFKFDGFGT